MRLSMGLMKIIYVYYWQIIGRVPQNGSHSQAPGLLFSVCHDIEFVKMTPVCERWELFSKGTPSIFSN